MQRAVLKILFLMHLAEADIKPHKITHYCENRNLDFESKMHNALLVYKQLEMQFDEKGKLIPYEDEFIHVLSYDEKPGKFEFIFTPKHGP